MCSQAFNESAHTLDFLSLLLSSYDVQAAKSSLTPYVQSTLPSQSLGAEIITKPLGSTSNQGDALTSTGWKLQSLNSSADSLLKAAKRLEKEVSLETQFWSHVLSIKDRGWPISRLPRAKQVLAARFGCLESPTEFREKGLAPLRRSEDGSIDLDLSTAVKGPAQALRARVIQNNTTIACSTGRIDSMDDDSLDSTMVRARDNIFDVELFDVLYREGRLLTSRGVRCYDNTISIPLEEDKVILIELVDQIGNVPPPLPEDVPKQYQSLPQLAIIALRLLLLHSHRQNYRRRIGKPPPISERPIQRIPPIILRPITSYLQHRKAIKELKGSLQQLRTVLRNAGLDLDIGSPEEALDLAKVLEIDKSRQVPNFVHDAMESISGALQTSLEIKVPKQGTQLSIQIRTHLIQTQYKLLRPGDKMINPNIDLVLPEDATYNDESDVLSLMAEVIQTDFVKQLTSQSVHKWHSEAPMRGELETKPENGYYHQVRVDFRPNKLRLMWAVAHFMQQISSQTVKIWDRSSAETSKVGLLNAIDMISSAPVDANPAVYVERMLGD